MKVQNSLKDVMGCSVLHITIKKNEFLLFRDRLGIKPLYYQINKKNLIFSSNVKVSHCIQRI